MLVVKSIQAAKTLALIEGQMTLRQTAACPNQQGCYEQTLCLQLELSHLLLPLMVALDFGFRHFLCFAS